eukprot:TRINITY_DN2066_c0_g1_i1.p1 TRINITY_DN2066_c0_g1~~TRINITY_DN2066_c0_g1_i1.p1  ORF type:complete len:461 (+),score=45.04 TRINITY_DN2066_c0_g1_i1:130-1512(+)
MSMYNQSDKLLSPPYNPHVGTSSPVSHLAINLQFSSISLPTDAETTRGESSPRSESKPSEGRRPPKVTPLILPTDENTCPQTRGNGSNPSPRAMRKLFPELDSPFPSRKNKSSHDETEPNKRLGISTLRSSDPGPLQFEDTPSPVPSPTPIRQKKKLSQSANSWSFDLTQDSLSCPSSPLPGQMRSANLPPRPPSRCATRDRSISIAIQPNGTPDFSITSPISSIQASFTAPHSPIRDIQLRLPSIIHPPFELPPITDVTCPPTPPLSDDVPANSPPDILPNTERDRLKFIEPSTLLDVLNGRYNCRHVIIDCRFKFEYDGGHIIGAINIHEQEQLEATFFSNTDTIQENCILIFHCEFSSLRGPTLCQHLRSFDRATNIDCYPKLHYPHAYVLTGGYKRFYEEHPTFCFPNGYVTMDDPQFSTERKEKMTSLRKGKSLKGRFRSFSDLRSLHRETDNNF